jgi:hypothetical protein
LLEKKPAEILSFRVGKISRIRGQSLEIETPDQFFSFSDLDVGMPENEPRMVRRSIRSLMGFLYHRP